MNSEIIIGKEYTSIIGTSDPIAQLGRNYDYDERNEVAYTPIYRQRTIRTKDFFSTLQSNITNSNEILPTGCKYFQTFDNGYKCIIIEEPPRIRTIKVDVSMDAVIEKLKITGKLKEYGYEDYLSTHSKPYNFQLSFPYVVFIIFLNKDNEMVRTLPFFRLHPITTLSDYLFICPLYNIPTQQNICLGGVQNFNSVYDTVDNIIETFWINIYNKDYTNNIKRYDESEAYEVHDYFTWMHFTKINPMFIYNVKWISHDMNINGIINDFRSSRDRSRNSGDSYNLIHRSIQTSHSNDLNPDPKCVNISNSIIMDGTAITIGDELLFEDKKYYLYSIISNDKGDTFTSFELEDENEVLINVPYRDFKRGFKSTVKLNLLDEVNINGVIVKPGDIISCKLMEYVLYKKITSLRRAFDGKIEARIGNDHYLIENINFELISLDTLEINGEPLDKHKTYYAISRDNNFNVVINFNSLKFHDIELSSNGKILLKFKHIDENRETITIDHSKYLNEDCDYKFIPEQSIECPETLCHFDKLLLNEIRKGYSDDHKFKIIKNVGIIRGYKKSIREYKTYSIENNKTILSLILKDNGTRLHIPSTFVDINFKIGDPVVYANWVDPASMLLIYTVDGFEFDDSKRMLFINITSLNKKLSYKIPYVNLKDSTVDIGVIRKVASQCNGLNSGDKIKANIPGIPNFPKKDCNSIIAFINDGSTPFPIAICSNLCTIWIKNDFAETFNVYKVGTTLWKKYKTDILDVSKIKWQSGDFFKRRDRSVINFVSRRAGTQQGFEYHYINNSTDIEWGYSIEKNELSRDCIRHGINMPRIQVSNYNIPSRPSFPNMLGGFIETDKARVNFNSEQFSEEFTNVSSMD